MNRLPAPRRELAAAMVRSGSSIAETARALGVCRATIHAICHRSGVPLPPRPVTAQSVRNVHESMHAPEWDGICLWRRATAEACRRVGTWQCGDVLACDEHRDAMLCRVPVPQRQVAS